MKTKFTLTGMEPPRAVCLVLLLGLCVYWAAHAGTLMGNLNFGAADLGTSEYSDFFVYYAAARFLLDGGSLAGLYDPSTFKAFQVSLGAEAHSIHPFAYPPSYAWLIKPLGHLPYAWALMFWIAGTLALYICSLRLAGLRLIETIAAITAPASAINIAAGQNGFLTSALLIAGMALMTRRPVASGVLFGILTIKPHLGLLIPFAALARRRWSTIAAAAAVTLVIVAVSTLALGGDAWPAYLGSLHWFATTVDNQAAGSVLTLSSTALTAAKIAGLPAPLHYIIQGTLSLFAIGAVYWAYRQGGDKDRLLALMLVGTAITMPYAFFYDMSFVAVAVILMVRNGLRNGFLPYEALCIVTVFLAPFMGQVMNEAGFPLVPLAHLVFFVYILAHLHPGLARIAPPQGPTPRPYTGI